MLFKLVSLIAERSNEDRGAVAAEYAVLLALIAAVVAAAVLALQGGIVAAFNAARAVLP